MKAYAEIVKERLSNASNTGESKLIDKLNAQVDRITGLINDLLDTTRVAEGKLILAFENLDIKLLLEERIEEIKYATNNTLTLVAEEVPPVTADKERIGQVITNLLSNAVKYSPKNSAIELRVDTTKDGYLSRHGTGPVHFGSDHSPAWWYDFGAK